MTRLPERNLDILRTIAVLCVLCSHAIDPWAHTVGPLTTWQLGRVGVLLFFVHTSLVLMSSLERLERTVPVSWAWTKTFYIRRAFRIYPLAIAAVIVVCALHVPLEFMNRGPHPAYSAPTLGTILANLFLVQNLLYRPDVLGPLWSLPVEVQMYVLLPVLYLAAKRSLRATLTILGVAILGGLALKYAPIPGLGRLTILTFAPCFMAGVTAYAILRKTTPTLPSWLWPFVMLGAIGIFALANPSSQNMERAWPFCIALGLALPFVRELPESWFTHAARTVAKYSYGIYLSHVVLLWFAFVVLYTSPPVIQWLVFALGVVVVPFIAYHLIEAPGIKWGIRVAHGSPKAAENPRSASGAPAP